MRIRILIYLFLLVLLIPSCLRREYGNELKIQNFTPVYQLKKYPENYLDKMVKIKGKVVDESSRGYWITVQDHFIVIMVLFQDEPVLLPDVLHKTVLVEGQFIRSKDGYMLKGKFVRII